MPRPTHRKPGILRGLDKESIISTEDTCESRHTTRQAVHGRPEALYDIKYHPMDDVVRPSNAKRHYGHAITRAESEEEDEGERSQLGSDSDSDDSDDERKVKSNVELKRKRSGGTRHSKRVGTQKVIDYSTQRHPQDEMLKLVDRDIVRVRAPPKKRARRNTPVIVQSSAESEDSEDEIELPRAAAHVPRRFSPSVVVGDSASESDHSLSEPDPLFDEIYPPEEVPKASSDPEKKSIYPSGSSLVPYSDSENEEEVPEQFEDSEQPQDQEQPDDEQQSENNDQSEDENTPDSPQQSQAEASSNAQPEEVNEKVVATKIPRPLPQYSSDVSFSSTFSAGQAGKAFSESRAARRARNQNIEIYQDDEPKHISLASRTVTEMISYDLDDHPKENDDVAGTERASPRDTTTYDYDGNDDDGDGGNGGAGGAGGAEAVIPPRILADNPTSGNEEPVVQIDVPNEAVGESQSSDYSAVINAVFAETPAPEVVDINLTSSVIGPGSRRSSLDRYPPLRSSSDSSHGVKIIPDGSIAIPVGRLIDLDDRTESVDSVEVGPSSITAQKDDHSSENVDEEVGSSVVTMGTAIEQQWGSDDLLSLLDRTLATSGTAISDRAQEQTQDPVTPMEQIAGAQGLSQQTTHDLSDATTTIPLVDTGRSIFGHSSDVGTSGSAEPESSHFHDAMLGHE
ncbi:hypothetical protein EJ08DRAFT_441237 [Tothia fuscella]|uniref:Uncharacterized protein n=1 Tax=Tothia fuscella TaxID=1048955 RepID=A0A9P4TTZ3_9PEZI|nr:hypothetical protein EJ08DRAFT_441237 [Tothia fuscella]